MKKASIISLILSFVFSFTCFSMPQTYNIEEAGMSFAVDTDNFDFIFFNGELVSNSDLISFEDLFGTSTETYSQYVQENLLYFDAISIDGLAEIYIRIEENDYSKSVYDFDNYTEDELYNDFNSMVGSSDYEEMLNEMGISEENSKITEVNDTIYYYLDGTTNEIYATTYYTIKNGKNISISLNMYNPEKLDTYNDLLKNLVESISFTDIDVIQNIDNMQNTASSDTSSSPVLKVIGGCIIGVILGIIAVAIGMPKNNKNNKNINSNAADASVSNNNTQQADTVKETLNNDSNTISTPDDNYSSQSSDETK